MGDYREKLISLIYPRRCPVCDKAVPKIGMMICPSCHEGLRVITDPVCMKCGKPAEAGQEWCEDCARDTHVYTRGAALYRYADVRQSIYRMKYGGRREYIDYFADEMVRHLGTQIRLWQADALIGVPLHKARLRKRGYNQADLLAKKVGAKMGIPFYPDAVRRVQNTQPQKGLNVQERQNNLKKAFIIGQNVVKSKVIIVIDDIYTTGSTIDAVAGTLLAAGALRVYSLTLAIGDTSQIETEV